MVSAQPWWQPGAAPPISRELVWMAGAIPLRPAPEHDRSGAERWLGSRADTPRGVEAAGGEREHQQCDQRTAFFCLARLIETKTGRRRAVAGLCDDSELSFFDKASRRTLGSVLASLLSSVHSGSLRRSPGWDGIICELRSWRVSTPGSLDRLGGVRCHGGKLRLCGDSRPLWASACGVGTGSLEAGELSR